MTNENPPPPDLLPGMVAATLPGNSPLTPARKTTVSLLGSEELRYGTHRFKCFFSNAWQMPSSCLRRLRKF